MLTLLTQHAVCTVNVVKELKVVKVRWLASEVTNLLKSRSRPRLTEEEGQAGQM